MIVIFGLLIGTCIAYAIANVLFINIESTIICSFCIGICLIFSGIKISYSFDHLKNLYNYWRYNKLQSYSYHYECDNCHSINLKQDKYCHKCGEKVKKINPIYEDVMFYNCKLKDCFVISGDKYKQINLESSKYPKSKYMEDAKEWKDFFEYINQIAKNELKDLKKDA